MFLEVFPEEVFLLYFHFCFTVDLQRAVIEGKTHIVRAAFKMNISLNVEQPDANGATLLMHACSNRHDEILKLLIVKGASVNACSKSGLTPLMHVSDQVRNLLQF